MSNCCCPCPSTGGSEPTPDPANPDPTEPPCSRFQVTFTSISVSNVDDGFLGGDLETTWTFVVNGQVRTVSIDPLGTGVTTLGTSFFVEAPAQTGSIVISVSGVETDTFFDDDLPGFTHTWGSAQNFGQGARQGSGSNDHITYQMNYTIACAGPSIGVMSRANLVRMAQASRKVRDRQVPDDVLLSFALGRLRAKGFAVVGTTAEGEFMLEGPGNLLSLFQRQVGDG